MTFTIKLKETTCRPFHTMFLIDRSIRSESGNSCLPQNVQSKNDSKILINKK